MTSTDPSGADGPAKHPPANIQRFVPLGKPLQLPALAVAKLKCLPSAGREQPGSDDFSRPQARPFRGPLLSRRLLSRRSRPPRIHPPPCLRTPSRFPHIQGLRSCPVDGRWALACL